jgi:hypothetical protein
LDIKANDTLLTGFEVDEGLALAYWDEEIEFCAVPGWPNTTSEERDFVSSAFTEDAEDWGDRMLAMAFDYAPGLVRLLHPDGTQVFNEDGESLWQKVAKQ